MIILPTYLVRDENHTEKKYQPVYPSLPDLTKAELTTFQLNDEKNDYIYEISGQQNSNGIIFFTIYSEKGVKNQIIINKSDYRGADDQELDHLTNFTYSYMNHSFGPLSGEYDHQRLQFLQLQVTALPSPLEEVINLRSHRGDPISICEEQ